MMSIPPNLFQPVSHKVVQKQRDVPQNACVRISSHQDYTPPTNTPAQLAGLRYENRVGKLLSTYQYEYGAVLYSHLWFDVGNQRAQPDFFLLFPSGAAILFEAKKTWVDTSNQLAFYKHLLEQIGLGPITCCTVCANLTPETPRDTIIHGFEDICEGAVWLIR